jgi:amino acid transporter
MIIAAAGMAVYLEFGTGIPKNGGEKNYLEYVFKKPRFLATGLYTGYVLLLGKYHHSHRSSIDH